VDINRMEWMLGVPVVPICAATGEGVEEVVRHAIHVARHREAPAQPVIDLPGDNDDCLRRCHTAISNIIAARAEAAQLPLRFAASKIIEGDEPLIEQLKLSGDEKQAIEAVIRQMEKERGLDAAMVNFYDPSFDARFDTVLMLMNGTGIIGSLENMPVFFDRIRQLLNPGGSVLIDSSDLRYLFEEEDGSLMIDLADEYYGQLVYQMQYKDVSGEEFDWLYVDFDTLAYYAEENGFKAEILMEGEHYDYLARLTLA
jgi:hypothetical protein